MLIKCPECELQVSDKAISCPHCGYPIDKAVYKNRKSTPKKRMRLPNGFGQISEIKGRNLRKPFRAMVTVGKDENGRPICKTLKPNAYFETYNEAYAALMEYNKNPYDLSPSITMKELYDKWSEEHFKSCGENRKRNIRAAWAYCEPLYNMPVSSIRVRHLKECVDSASKMNGDNIIEASPSTKRQIKTVFNTMFDYAMEYEMTDKNYARMFTISDRIREEIDESYKGHISFTDEEMRILWNHTDNQCVRMILIQCYSGWRPQELMMLRLCDVTEDRFVSGLKTDAGKNRVVPIHSKIKTLVKCEYNKAETLGSNSLFNRYADNLPMPYSYQRYRDDFAGVINELGLNPEHRPHDCRKQFITMAKKYHLDEYAIKRIVGHAINDITEKVYTERDFEWLREEIEKIK